MLLEIFTALIEAQSLIFKGVKSQNDVDLKCWIFLFLSWTFDLNSLQRFEHHNLWIFWCVSKPPSSPFDHSHTLSSSPTVLTKVTSIKTASFIKDHLRFSESARLTNAFTGPWIVCSQITFWEGAAETAGRRREWLRSHLNFQPTLWNVVEVWLSVVVWLSGSDLRCSRRLAPLWSCPWGGSRSCHSRDPCSQGGWHREAASAGRKTPARSSTDRCNTRVGRLQQDFNTRWPTCGKILVRLQCFNRWMEEIREFTFWEIFFSLFGSHARHQWPT